MKILTILLVVRITPVLAEDFKTYDGKEYKKATVRRVESDGIVVSTKGGISKRYFNELSEDVRKQFHYDREKADAYTAQEAAALQTAARQAAQSINQQQEQQKQHREQGGRQGNIQDLQSLSDPVATRGRVTGSNRTNQERTRKCAATVVYVTLGPDQPTRPLPVSN